MADIFPEGFESQRELAVKTADDLDMVISTGYALFAMRGGDGSWNRQDLRFEVGPQWDAVLDTVVVVSPASMYNKNAAVDAGWAVDRVDLTYLLEGSQGLQVSLTCKLAVRDIDGILYRVNYHVTTVGRLTAQPGRFSSKLKTADDLATASASAK